MHTFNINRRQFLKGATATLALSAFGAQAMGILHPQKTWRVSLIGTGWYGKSDLFRLMQVAPVEVVALCDVDKNLLNEAATMVSKKQKSGKTPRLYSDYHKMLSENQPDIVLIGTPDHWHCLNAIDAMKSGAHVYLQKPISVDVMEGEAMLAAARKYKRTVQVGLQRRSTPHLIEAKKNIVDAGLLGKISHVEMFCYYHMRNTIGNVHESAIAAGDLIFGGVLDDFPKLDVVLPHAGGSFPWLIGRWDNGVATRKRELGHMKQPASKYLRRFWYDSVVFGGDYLAYLVKKVGVSQIIGGSDGPVDFGQPSIPRLVASAGLAGMELSLIQELEARLNTL